jgi:FkbM family methyltransferase
MVFDTDSFYRKLRRLTRIAYTHRGAARLAEKVRLHYLSVDRTYMVDDFDGSSKFFCGLNEHIGSQIFWRGAYSGDELTLLDRILRPDMTFLDVGANQGEFSVFAAPRLSAGRIISLEPVSFLFERLQRNVTANGFRNVTTLQRGLSDRDAVVGIYMVRSRFTDGSLNEGLPSTVRFVDAENEIEQIRVIPLDSLVADLNINRLDVMKVDVEGAEMRVLLGAAESIYRFRPVILLEINDETCRSAGYRAEDLIDYVEKMGYRIERIGKEGVCTSLRPRPLCEFQNVVCWPQSTSKLAAELLSG